MFQIFTSGASGAGSYLTSFTSSPARPPFRYPCPSAHLSETPSPPSLRHVSSDILFRVSILQASNFLSFLYLFLFHKLNPLVKIHTNLRRKKEHIYIYITSIHHEFQNETQWNFFDENPARRYPQGNRMSQACILGAPSTPL